MRKSEMLTRLRNKIMNLFFLVVIMRVILYIPVAGHLTLRSISPDCIDFIRDTTGVANMSIGSLGIVPYMNGTFQLRISLKLFSKLRPLQNKEGGWGQQKIDRYSRYLTLVWSLVGSMGLIYNFVDTQFGYDLISHMKALKIILSLTTGSIIVMWFSELITAEGLGDGSSVVTLVTTAGAIGDKIIIYVQNLYHYRMGFEAFFSVIDDVLSSFFFIVLIILFQQSIVQIKVFSRKQNFDLRGSDRYSYIPLKLSQAGVMPLFATLSIIYWLQDFLTTFSITYSNFLTFYFLVTPSFFWYISRISLISVLVIRMSVFSALISTDTQKIAKRMLVESAVVPGIRPGKRTEVYLRQKILQLAFIDGIIMSLIVVLPLLVSILDHRFFFSVAANIILCLNVISALIDSINGNLVELGYSS
jgi:preprotein translocase subunit SecY